MAEPRDHISCSELVELVTDYLDGALAADEHALFEQHLNLCDGCVRYVDQFEQTIALVGELREEDIPADAKARLLAAFAAWEGR